MTVSADGPNRTVLLILPSEKRLLALSTAALTQAQATPRELSEGYRDALILDRDGDLRRVEKVTVVGAWGDSLLRKALNRLNNGWRIAVQLSPPMRWNLDELKKTLYEYISLNGGVESPHPEERRPNQEVAAGVLAASSLEEVFDVLRLPSPEDALDVL